MPIISELYTYPIKGCRGISHNQAFITHQGMKGDRQLAVISEGEIITQLKLPALAKIAPERIADQTITLSADGFATIEHSISNEGDSIDVDIYGNLAQVLIQDKLINQWLSDVVQKNVQLVNLAQSFSRSIPLEEFSLLDNMQQNRFIDIGPVLLSNQSSLDDLNSRLDTAVSMQRFRPNIVVSGLEAFAEDSHAGFSHQAISLIRSGACERCAVTCTDPLTGQRDNQPLRTLRTYRKRDNAYASGIVFGAYMGIEGEGLIRLGDSLTAY